jgi:hypothetical protein
MKFLSSILSSASGSVAGSTYSRNASGAYIRNRSVPTNPNTLAQQAARASFGSASNVWRSLTAAQKQTFADQVSNYPYIDALGQSKTYTPSQLCMTVNNRVKQMVGISDIDGSGFAAFPTIVSMPAPIPIIFPEDAQCTYDISSNALNLGVGLADALTELPDGYAIIVDATAIKSDGFYRPKNSDYRVIGGYASLVTDMFSTGVNVITNYLATFPGTVFSLSSNFYLRVTVIADNGMYSSSAYTKVVVQA